ncbi:hypothetical protein N7492_000576 [Penicillium capsulatum]|uniref:Uncharacterized protein n=1 Tax=Penicillium capsulatum TaxID=69766 RepID=A0A9W9IQP4_9EURO|nr:hypothetical protein N7492_000576 [Penicillium capsulatum]KAJ6130366.1 hypothetical protein N7512_003146 [Penicillium capsulatum]
MLTTKLANEINTFTLFYGAFTYADQCYIDESMVRAMQVIHAVRTIDTILLDFAFSGFYSPVIFCTDEAFKYVRTEGQKKFFQNTHDPEQREVKGKAGTPKGLCDDYPTRGLMMYPTTGEMADWMLLCPALLNQWLGIHSDPDPGPDSNSDSDWDSESDLDLDPPVHRRYISQYRELGLADLIDRHLDEIMTLTPEGTLGHELTHSAQIFTLDPNIEQIMGDLKQEDLFQQLQQSGHIFNLLSTNEQGQLINTYVPLNDIEIHPGNPAYEFDKVTELARVSKDRPLGMVRNAETLAWHAGAAYLNKCKWTLDGYCQSPVGV